MERWQPAAAALGALVCAGGALGAPALARWALRAAVPRTLTWRATAVVGAAAAGALVAGRAGMSTALPAYVAFVITGTALSYADVAAHRLPHRLTIPAVIGGLALLAIPALADSEGAAYARAAVAGLVLCAAYLVLHLASPGGVGGGDVRYAAAVGLHLGWLGWAPVLVGTFAAAAAGALAGLAVAARRPQGLKAHVAFGPAMFAGAVLAIGLGPDVAADWIVWAR